MDIVPQLSKIKIHKENVRLAQASKYFLLKDLQEILRRTLPSKIVARLV
jgi:hypothetical protein